ncbi:MAG: aspartate--ammonia ligase [Clostridia bacterium]|nr:aspartate--ammonia ligase [Clostridia bacterium]
MSHKLTIPEGYKSYLSVRDTQRAIKIIRDTFEDELAAALNLERISAPLFVRSNSGLNDDLNGVERAIKFDVKNLGFDVEIVHSLAKWKRNALKVYGFSAGEGLYTDMNAIRRDEDFDNLHSIYVDQWDWELCINASDRNEEFLKQVVLKLFSAIKNTEAAVYKDFPAIVPSLPDDVFFITSEELLKLYPDIPPKERENEIAREKKCVFIMKIGDKLSDGAPHDGRAPDYDDWELNGDLIFYYEPLSAALEVSSMGIRVDEKSLREQLKKAGCPEREKLRFHTELLNGELPLTVGGGIGQSRMCMMLLKKAHIGEVQTSEWPDGLRAEAEENGIFLL